MVTILPDSMFCRFWSKIFFFVVGVYQLLSCYCSNWTTCLGTLLRLNFTVEYGQGGPILPSSVDLAWSCVKFWYSACWHENLFRYWYLDPYTSACPSTSTPACSCCSWSQGWSFPSWLVLFKVYSARHMLLSSLDTVKVITTMLCLFSMSNRLIKLLWK